MQQSAARHETPHRPCRLPAGLLARRARAAETATIKRRDLYNWDPSFSDIALAGAGSRITNAGFMVSLPKASSVFFVLTKMPMAVCPFCDPGMPWPDGMLAVQNQAVGRRHSFNLPITVTGVLEPGDAPLRFVFDVVWPCAAALIVRGARLGLALVWIAARGISAVITARTDVPIFLEAENTSTAPINLTGGQALSQPLDLAGFICGASGGAGTVLPMPTAGERHLTPEVRALRWTDLSADLPKGCDLRIDVHLGPHPLTVMVEIRAADAIRHNHAGLGP